MKEKIRALAIEILDDEQGVNEAAYDILRDILHENDEQDILELVDACEGRFYLPEQAAEALRAGTVP